MNLSPMRPHIGDKAMFYVIPGVKALGTIMDIRDDEHGERVACIAVLGHPNMAYIPVRQYGEKRDEIWRACGHPRGFNVAGICFDCGGAVA